MTRRFAVLLCCALASVLAVPAISSAMPVPRRRSVPELSGKVVVMYEAGRRSAALAAAESLGGTEVAEKTQSGVELVEPPAGVSPTEFARELDESAGVALAYPEPILKTALVPSDEYFKAVTNDPGQWNMRLIGMPPVWDLWRGTGVKVGIIDTGMQQSHIDLKRWTVGRDLVNNDTAPYDDQGHGTHVAGIIAAKINNRMTGYPYYVGVAGIADRSSLYIYKALNRNGEATESRVEQAIRYAIADDVDILNLSLASQNYTPQVDRAIRDAYAAGITIVAAAGNEGTNLLTYPAILPEALSVGSVGTANASGQLVSENTHSSFSNSSPELDVVAPGVRVISTIFNPARPTEKDWFGALDGTSMAAPHATGIAALVRQKFPTITVANMFAHMRATAQDLGTAGTDDQFGSGLVRGQAVSSTSVTQANTAQIPGVPLPVSPVDASLVANEPAVFELHAIADSEVELWFNGPEGSTVEVYDRHARTLAAATPIAVAGPSATPRASFVATETGGYYVVLKSGTSGAYRLSYWSTSLANPDNDIPGVPLPASPVAGTVDRVGDLDDVFAINLQPGQGITATLTSSAAYDGDLYLYGPGATSVESVNEIVAGSAADGLPERLSYSGTGSGTYSLDVNAFSGTGPYELDWVIGTGSALSMTGPSTCYSDGTARLSGSLTKGLEPTAVAGARVDIYTSSTSHGWTKVGSTITQADGSWTYTVRPSFRSTYVAEYTGAPDGSVAGDLADPKVITGKAYLTLPRTPSKVYRYRYFTAWGLLRPYHTAGAKSVRIYAYRREGGKWVKRRTFYPKNYRYNSTTTKYSMRMALPYRGSWKLVSYVSASSNHAATYSPPRYLTVR